MYLTESHIIVCYVYLVVLFFKQKTAYEMRISDWSSDVCSSDLNAVKDDSKRSIDIFSRHPRELAAARSVKPDVDHRLIVLLIKALLRIDELIAAGCADGAFDRVALLRAVQAWASGTAAEQPKSKLLAEWLAGDDGARAEKLAQIGRAHAEFQS